MCGKRIEHSPSDGLEVITQLRSQTPDARILAISGGGQYGFHFYLDVAQKLGANGIVYKPFTKQQILDEVYKLLE